MLRQRKIRCCRAAEEPAIRAECSKDQRLNSQIADKAAVNRHSSKVGFLRFQNALTSSRGEQFSLFHRRPPSSLLNAGLAILRLTAC